MPGLGRCTSAAKVLVMQIRGLEFDAQNPWCPTLNNPNTAGADRQTDSPQGLLTRKPRPLGEVQARGKSCLRKVKWKNGQSFLEEWNPLSYTDALTSHSPTHARMHTSICAPRYT